VGTVVVLLPEQPADFCVSGGEMSDQIHLTIAYSPVVPDNLAELTSALSDIAARSFPVSGEVHGFALFPQDDGTDAVVALINADGLPEFRRSLRDDLDRYGFPGDRWATFLPHVTVGYAIDPACVAGLEGLPVRFARLAIWVEGDQSRTFNLGEPALAPEHRVSEPIHVRSPYTIEIDEALVASGGDEDGMVRWEGPIVVEGLPTGDGREFDVGALTWRLLPLSLMFMLRNPDGGVGHDAAELVGRIDTLERREYDGRTVLWGTGVIDPTMPLGEVATRARRRELYRGISVDVGDVRVRDEFPLPPGATVDMAEEWNFGREFIAKGCIVGATLCPMPAFADAHINLVEETMEDTAIETVELTERERVLLAAVRPVRRAQVAALAGKFGAPRPKIRARFNHPTNQEKPA
jgi:2'-5' RNA ligase superfamily